MVFGGMKKLKDSVDNSYHCFVGKTNGGVSGMEVPGVSVLEQLFRHNGSNQ